MLSFIVSLIFPIILLTVAIFLLYKTLKTVGDKKSKLDFFVSIASLSLTVYFSINIKPPTPVILPLDNETHIYSDNAEITIESDGFDIYYTLDGSDPKNGVKYNQPIIIMNSTTILARSKFLWKWSETSKSVYKFKDPEYQSTNPEFTPIINIEQEIKNIREKYYSLPNPHDLSEPTANQPINKCYDDNNMKIIKVYSGYNGTNYSRMYYYDENDNLYFALIFYKDEKENRLYFKNDYLIRYIDENSVIHDSDKETIVCDWTEFALKDSYEIFKQCK